MPSLMISIMCLLLEEPTDHVKPHKSLEQPSMRACFGRIFDTITLNQIASLSVAAVAERPALLGTRIRATSFHALCRRLHFLQGSLEANVRGKDVITWRNANGDSPRCTFTRISSTIRTFLVDFLKNSKATEPSQLECHNSLSPRIRLLEGPKKQRTQISHSGYPSTFTRCRNSPLCTIGRDYSRGAEDICCESTDEDYLGHCIC